MPRMDRRAWALTINKRLKKVYPEAKCALEFKSPLQLLIATILSAQCTDARVNMVTPALFKRFPSARDFADGDIHEIEEMIRTAGFFRAKARSIQETCRLIVERFAGSVPATMEELLQLRGVARKTANVVLGNAFGIPGLPVDTHVGRLSRRLGLTKNTDPVKVEKDLSALLPAREWTMFAHRLISHGRAICQARTPNCVECVLSDQCPMVGVPKKEMKKKPTGKK